ncbi:hypothetical protein ETAE_2406 [Edwardsiella piscicida]|uniref:Uncharacterized protein n=1 Tax=Edwardsiella piscicida TaxID=1263550 RepID=A0AAU8P8Z6_EDWPI|nr:hypothetical protein ETAE_2406 [Edwardsiella tarda EIB202]
MGNVRAGAPASTLSAVPGHRARRCLTCVGHRCRRLSLQRV